MRVAPEIVLTSEERSELSRLVQSGGSSARLVHRARIVLLAAGGMQNKDIAEELKVGRVQVSRWRERYLELRIGGIERDLPRGTPSPTVDVRALVDMTTKIQPNDGSQWSTRKMASAMGISPASVSRHWRTNGLTPQALRDPDFQSQTDILDTIDDVVGLYISSAVHIVVFSCDASVRLRATQTRSLPTSHTKRARAANDVEPNSGHDAWALASGIRTLVTASQSADKNANSHSEWLQFFRRIEREVAPETRLQLLTDDRTGAQHPQVQQWLSKHKQLKLNFVPDGTWTVYVEQVLSRISQDVARNKFVNAPRLVAAIAAYMTDASANVGTDTFLWTVTTGKVSQESSFAAKLPISSPSLNPLPGAKTFASAQRKSKALSSEKGHSLREHVTALKRDRILQEAATLFFERGYLQTSVDAIAERLGATKPFVYYHFQSKLDILVEICERSNRDALAAVESAMLAEGTPRARLEQFLRDFTNIALQQHQLVAIYFREEMSLPEDASERINQMRKTISLRLGSLLKEGIDSGEFQVEDPRIGALVIAGMSSYAFAWYRERGRLDQLEVTDRIVKMALKLVSAAPYHRPANQAPSVNRK